MNYNQSPQPRDEQPHNHVFYKPHVRVLKYRKLIRNRDLRHFYCISSRTHLADLHFVDACSHVGRYGRRRLLERIAELERENAELQQALKDALARIEELLRAGKRQAAPFGKEEQQKIPPEKQKKRGRKKGHPGARRPRPPHVDREVIEKLECCPHCQGKVDDLRPITQYIEELPEIKPEVTRLTTFKGTRMPVKVRTSGPGMHK